MSPHSTRNTMSSRTITIVSSGRSTELDYNGNLLVSIPTSLLFMSLWCFEADLYHLSVHSGSLLSGLRMHDTQLSSNPKLPLEEDRESGIGSTLDLSSSFEGYNQHTNHHHSKPSLQLQANRLPKEQGTRAARTGDTHSFLELAVPLTVLKDKYRQQKLNHVLIR